MIDFSQMLVRLAIALTLGALIGLERELVRKEAGMRTTMMVSAGSAIFTMIALILPYLVAVSPENLSEILARNGGFLAVIANVVIGIGFLGAGTIVKTEDRVHGLTTAAVIWVAAAIGVLAGLGIIKFAVVTTILILVMLSIFRKAGVADTLRS